MSSWDIHHDESIFPDSFTFQPERWLDDVKAPTSRKPLQVYLCTFGKGSRACLGMNLAYAEIALAIASLFRRFEFTLIDTDRSDVATYRDEIGPVPKPETKGVRVVVR